MASFCLFRVGGNTDGKKIAFYLQSQGRKGAD